MTASDPRLAQIRALCDAWSGDVDLADRIRAVLDAAPMAATPAQGIDRDALLRTFAEYGFSSGADPHSWRCYHPDRYGACDCAEQIADAILALVRPVEGVTLSPEEIHVAVNALHFERLHLQTDDNMTAYSANYALAARLEAAQ